MRRRLIMTRNYLFTLVTDPPMRTHWEWMETVDWYNQVVLPWVLDQFGQEGVRWCRAGTWKLTFREAEDAFAFKMRWG